MAGNDFFMVENSTFAQSKLTGKHVRFEDVKIAYRELLAAVIAFLYFAPKSPSSLVRINCDNQNVVAWLNKGRCSKKLGYRLLAIIELVKLKFNLKVSAVYIKSSSNVSADALSRGKIPRWLEMRGERVSINMQRIDRILLRPISFWKKALFEQGRLSSF